MKTLKVGIVLAVMTLIAPQLALAVVTFDQLSDDVFVVSHRVKLIGGRGQAMRIVYEKAASVCVATGYTHMAIIDQESQTWQHEEAANASIRVRFFLEGGEERIDCRTTASERFIEQARVKLVKKGYGPPVAPEDTSVEAIEGYGTCSLDQVSVMERIGLSDRQIDAACSE